MVAGFVGFRTPRFWGLLGCPQDLRYLVLVWSFGAIAGLDSTICALNPKP